MEHIDTSPGESVTEAISGILHGLNYKSHYIHIHNSLANPTLNRCWIIQIKV
jgi:hypothetical protein